MDRLRLIAQQLRTFAPDKAAVLERALAEYEEGKRDLASINVGISYRLDKFAGEYSPGMAPVETIEGQTP